MRVIHYGTPKAEWAACGRSISRPSQRVPITSADWGKVTCKACLKEGRQTMGDHRRPKHDPIDDTAPTIRLLPAPTTAPLPTLPAAPIAIIRDNTRQARALLFDSLFNGTQDFALVVRKAAVMVRTRPDEGGTPVRCPRCLGLYSIKLDEEPDWSLVGLEFAPCIECLIAMSRALPASGTAATEAATDAE